MRVVVAIGVMCAVVQIASATWVVTDYETPNVSTEIARHLVATGEYATERTDVGTLSAAEREPLRAYQLPGEPLLLAAGFLLPPVMHRYLHVPVVVLFVCSIAATALAIGGVRLAAVAGGIAVLDPFVVAHGPVWDDTMLSAALEWFVIAALVTALQAAPMARSAGRRSGAAVLAALAAGAAAVTRTHGQLLVSALALLTVVRPRFAAARHVGLAAALGIVLAVGGWGWRNQQVVGSFIAGSTHDGKTFFESIYSTARGAILANGVAQGFEAGRVPAQFFVPFTGEVASNRFFMDEAWRHVREHPVDVAITGLFKTAVSLTGVDFGRPLTSVRNIGSVAANLALWIVAIAGVVAWRSSAPARSDAGRFLTAAGIATAVTTFMLLGAGPVGLRYRVTLAGFLYLAVAFALLTQRPDRAAAISARM